MKKLVFAFFALALIAGGCKNNSANKSNETEVGSVITLDELLTNPGEFVDKEIIVTGIVDHVCRHGGKRLLMVSDNFDIHVDSEEERFTDELNGKMIELNGIFREFRVDEAYCLQMEEKNFQSHRDGKYDDEAFEHEKENIQYYRDSMKVAGVEYLSYYSLDYISHIEK